MDSLEKVIADELRPLLSRVRAAQETLGMGMTDCAYKANKQLEPVSAYLQFLIGTLETPTPAPTPAPAPATIKVVINRCYGGFSLSQEAKTFFCRTEKFGHKHFDEYNIPRDNPTLVMVVEQLGEAADGDNARLKVVEIPADVNWYIEEYDGNEWVAERHRTWV